MATRYNHSTTNRFINIGGPTTGHKSYSENGYAYYEPVFSANAYPATKTDKRYFIKYAKQFYSEKFRWLPPLLHLTYVKTISNLLSSVRIYHVKVGKIVIGKFNILFYSRYGRLGITWQYSQKLNGQSYKVLNHVKTEHDYGWSGNKRSYQDTKNRNRIFNQKYKSE